MTRQGRRALRADGRSTRGASAASRRTRATTSPTTARSTAGALRVHRRRRAARARPSTTTPRSSAPTATPDSGEAAATGGASAARSPATAAPARATAPPTPSVVRRRPVRQGHRRPAALRASPSRRGGSKTVWLAVAGSDKGLGAAQQRAGRARCATRRGALAAKIAVARASSRSWTQLSLPGDPLAAERDRLGQAEPRRPHPDARTDLQIRWTNQGKQFPRAAGHRRRSASWIGAGFPDYPWIFATDGEYTAFAAVALGQFEADQGPPARAARHLRRPQRPLRRGRRTRSVSDGSIWFGHDSRRTNPDGTTTYDFNTDETVKFPSTVALIWRWTGDDALPRRDVRLRHAQPAATSTTSLDADNDGWPEGSGNVERAGHGPGEARQRRLLHPRRSTTSPTWRASKHDGATVTWATQPRRASCSAQFEATWWYDAGDSSTPTR